MLASSARHETAVRIGRKHAIAVTARLTSNVSRLRAPALQAGGWLVRMSSRDPRPILRWFAARFYSSGDIGAALEAVSHLVSDLSVVLSLRHVMTPAAAIVPEARVAHTRVLENASKEGFSRSVRCNRNWGGNLAYNQATKPIAATSTAAIAQSAASHSL